MWPMSIISILEDAAILEIGTVLKCRDGTGAVLATRALELGGAYNRPGARTCSLSEVDHSDRVPLFRQSWVAEGIEACL